MAGRLPVALPLLQATLMPEHNAQQMRDTSVTAL